MARRAKKRKAGRGKRLRDLAPSEHKAKGAKGGAFPAPSTLTATGVTRLMEEEGIRSSIYPDKY